MTDLQRSHAELRATLILAGKTWIARVAHLINLFS
jgi:hypothetical protein